MEETIVDAIYDITEIHHVLEPNLEGIRGVPQSQFIIRNTLLEVRRVLADFDQTKIDEYQQELIYKRHFR